MQFNDDDVFHIHIVHIDIYYCSSYVSVRFVSTIVTKLANLQLNLVRFVFWLVPS